MQATAMSGWLAGWGIAIAIVATGLPAAAQEWKPTRTVEFVVGSAPGGSPDIMARLIQGIFQTKGYVPSSTVVNKPGAANTIGWAYLNQHAGDAHYIATFSPAIIGNRLMGTSQLNYLDFTPLNILAREYVVIAVLASTPFKTLKDLTAQLKKDSQSVTFAFATARGNHNHTVMSMYLKAIGVDPKVAKAVIYPGGGPARAAFLGGHIDVYMASPLSMVPLQEEGKVRILGMSSAERQPGRKASIPTFREQGIDAVFATWRGFMSPKGLKSGEIAYWDGIFEKLANSKEWREELEKQMWIGDYTLSAATRKHLDRENAVMKTILTDLGLIKQP